MVEPRHYPHVPESRTPAEVAIDEFVATWAPKGRIGPEPFREALLELIDGVKYAYRFEVIAEVQHAFIAATSELDRKPWPKRVPSAEVDPHHQ